MAIHAKQTKKDNSMNQSLPFRIFGGISILRAVLFIFMTERYLASAGISASSDALLLAQGLGVTLFCFGLVSWRTPDIAGDGLKDYSQLFGIVTALYVVFLGYNTISGEVGGATVYVLIVVHLVLAALFFMNSKK